MLTVCHLAENAQNINRNTENYDHKCGITSTKLASKERSPTVASFASTISSHTQLLSLHFREEKQWFLVGVVLNRVSNEKNGQSQIQRACISVCRVV